MINLIVLGILVSIILNLITNLLYAVFLTTLLSNILLSLLKSAKMVSSLSTTKFSNIYISNSHQNVHMVQKLVYGYELWL